MPFSGACLFFWGANVKMPVAEASLLRLLRAWATWQDLLTRRPESAADTCLRLFKFQLGAWGGRPFAEDLG